MVCFYFIVVADRSPGSSQLPVADRAAGNSDSFVPDDSFADDNQDAKLDSWLLGMAVVDLDIAANIGQLAAVQPALASIVAAHLVLNP